jgi:hypothetical protein
MKTVIIAPEELKRVAVHESGHAVMAVIQGITCHGMFFAYEPNDVRAVGKWNGKFCVPVQNSTPLSKGDYLQAAAGAGAEHLFFGHYNQVGSRSDRIGFCTGGAPEWRATVEEAKTILEGKKEKIALMVKAFELIHQHISIEDWPDRGMDGRTTRFREMLGGEVLRQIVEGDGIPERLKTFFDSVQAGEQ